MTRAARSDVVARAAARRRGRCGGGPDRPRASPAHRCRGARPGATPTSGSRSPHRAAGTGTQRDTAWARAARQRIAALPPVAAPARKIATVHVADGATTTPFVPVRRAPGGRRHRAHLLRPRVEHAARTGMARAARGRGRRDDGRGDAARRAPAATDARRARRTTAACGPAGSRSRPTRRRARAARERRGRDRRRAARRGPVPRRRRDRGVPPRRPARVRRRGRGTDPSRLAPVDLDLAMFDLCRRLHERRRPCGRGGRRGRGRSAPGALAARARGADPGRRRRHGTRTSRRTAPSCMRRGRAVARRRAAHRAHGRRAVGEGRATLGRLAPRGGVRPRRCAGAATSYACRPSTTPTISPGARATCTSWCAGSRRCAARRDRPTCCGSSAIPKTSPPRSATPPISCSSRRRASPPSSAPRTTHARRGHAAGDRPVPLPARSAPIRRTRTTSRSSRRAATCSARRSPTRSRSGIRPAIYGSGWEPFVDPDARREHATSPTTSCPSCTRRSACC